MWQSPYCKLEIFLPASHLEEVREALQQVDAGHIGQYDSCLSYMPVTSCWRPLEGAEPYLGEVGKLYTQPELKVEVTCLTRRLGETLAAVRAAHPYEEPVINVLPLLATGLSPLGMEGEGAENVTRGKDKGGILMTQVVAALIWAEDRFLICQRPAHKARGLLWEFVGGKVEPGETREQALIRECQEELGVTVSVGPVFWEVTHAYPDLTVHLTLFHAAIAQGTPRALEHNDIRWIRVEEIPDYPFCPADEEILQALSQGQR